MKSNSSEDEFCPACGANHPTNIRPVLCHNILLLAHALREHLTVPEDEAEQASNELVAVCTEILGEEDEDEDGEVFR